MDWLPYITLMSKRPTAMRYTGFYQELPTDKKREALLTLSAILQKHDVVTATAALESAIQLGVKDADSILANYYRLTARVQSMQLKKAGFDNVKTFQGYDFEDITLPSTLTIDLLKQAQFLARQEKLILYGRNGAGKSHMATAIGVEACMQGEKVRFFKNSYTCE